MRLRAASRNTCVIPSLGMAAVDLISTLINSVLTLPTREDLDCMSERHASLRGPRRQLVFDLVETSRLLRSYIESIAADHGTTRAQWGLLAVLRKREGVSQAELAAFMEIAPISLARLIDRTQAEGYIERRAHDRDRRINRLFLTVQGRAAVDRLDRQREEIASTVLAGLDAAGIATTTSSLQRIATQIRARNNANTIAVNTNTPHKAARGAVQKKSRIAAPVA